MVTAPVHGSTFEILSLRAIGFFFFAVDFSHISPYSTTQTHPIFSTYVIIRAGGYFSTNDVLCS